MSDEALQRDEEHAATAEDAIQAQIWGALKDVHTALPGIVQSYDARKQTVAVQPAIKRVWTEQGPLPLPMCVDVPVQHLRGGNFLLTFPIAKGDEVLLCFTERCMDNWWDRGGVQDPAEVRYFDLSDAFAFTGFASRGRVPSNVSTDAVELRTLDGSTVLRMEAGTIYVGGKLGATYAIAGEQHQAAEQVLIQQLLAAFSALQAAAVGPLSALQPGFATANTAIAGFQASASAQNNFLARKAKVL
jgi:hypothetical protein